ncbi:hypothetical protein [Cystobacter ferrugineus]|uniref:Protein kinase n=1 Tax=Cystobacter ferrugineus TaxID=83449 RepID=A0A1L9B9F9_9BACT|nr:hypothetical protein [Cystobacter ferrugineus]OJH38910.1 hypothetical protein BON30_22105 [Cystobacter ferrugineus]
MANEKNEKEDGAGSFQWGRCYEVDPRLGRLHEAWNVVTGTPALTLVPGAGVAWQPEGPCRMSLIYEPERASVTLDLEQAPASVRTSELTNLFVLMAGALQRVEDDAQVDAHLAGGPVGAGVPGVSPVRRLWRFRTGLAAAGGAVLAVSLAVCLYSRLDAAHSHVGHRVWAIEDALRRESDFVIRSNPDSEAIAYPLPEKPWTKQAVPPCETNKGEVEINKGCWVELAKKPPCYSNQAEYQGKCYMPVRKQDPVPRSVQP